MEGLYSSKNYEYDLILAIVHRKNSCLPITILYGHIGLSKLLKPSLKTITLYVTCQKKLFQIPESIFSVFNLAVYASKKNHLLLKKGHPSLRQLFRPSSASLFFIIHS